MQSDGEISRAVTSMVRVSFNDLDNKNKNKNNNKLSIKNGNNINKSLQIRGGNDNIDNNNISDGKNNISDGKNTMDSLDRKGVVSNRRSSFRKSAQILGLELITSAMEIGLSNIDENE